MAQPADDDQAQPLEVDRKMTPDRHIIADFNLQVIDTPGGSAVLAAHLMNPNEMLLFDLSDEEAAVELAQEILNRCRGAAGLHVPSGNGKIVIP